MLDITHFGLFALSVLLLSVTPGPDIAYVVGQSVANGRRAGIISAAGVALGSCTHAVASAVGLTALIAASPMMFTVIKYLGAAYLVYLGSKMILGTLTKQTSDRSEADAVKTKATHASLLTKGFITTLTNPKVLLFFISFFPQFVSPGGEHNAASFLVLGMTYALIAFMTDLTFAVLAGSAAGAVSRNRKLQKLLDRIVGVTFIGLGLRLAMTRR
ncbi:MULTISPECIES: LysE family translocator [Enterobacter]|uniref:LysE family translocator n=1 Tax=Enterobacter TaxID=547 RepID=UPI001F56AD52|nr:MULTISPECIES: LysE family translocator [Enterobacter]MCI2290363.1 LysE family translocator [Enterobacter sp. I4]MCM7513154.1 LysE family translocator [Enterobacter hormaechei]MCY0773956.1 LysE family translocator [Enterobacter cloacae complex sp. 2022EL-00788]